MAGSDFSRPCITGYGSSPSRCGPARQAPVGREISRFPRKERPCVPGSLTTPGRRALALTHPFVWPSVTVTTSAPGTIALSRLNGRPARSPADASPDPSRGPTHGSGPVWLARPSLQRTFTSYSLPVSRRTTVGNIGAADRLDFTAIGPALNLVSRVEGLCRPLGRSVLISGAVAVETTTSLVPLGEHVLRGIAAPCTIFTLPDAEPGASIAAELRAGQAKIFTQVIVHRQPFRRAVDESYIAEAHELSGSLAEAPRRPDRKRRRPEAEAQDNVRRLVGYASVNMSRNRCGGVLGEIGNPPGIPSAFLLLLGGDGKRIG